MLPEHYISQILAPMDFFMGANVWRSKMPGSLCPKIKPFSVVSGMAKPEGMMVKMNRHKRRRSFLFVLNQQQQQSDSREGSQLVLRKHVGHFSGTKASPSQATVLPALKIKFDLFGKALLLNETQIALIINLFLIKFYIVQISI